MGDDQHRHAVFCQIEDDVQDFPDHLGIERRRHFIEEHDFRVRHQRSHDCNPLLLPAGQLPREAMRFIFQTNPFQQRNGFFGCLLFLAFLNF